MEKKETPWCRKTSKAFMNKKQKSRVRRLSIDERTYIAGAKKRGLGPTLIGEALGRDKSVISRELKRNKVFYEQSSLDSLSQSLGAQKLTEEKRRLASQRKRLKSQTIRDYVEEKLKQFITPELISGRIKIDLPGHSISIEAIYQWIYTDREDLKCYLMSYGKERRKKRSGSRKKLKQPKTPKKSIDLRPIEANDRLEIGHLETDAVVSKKSKAAISTTVDRKSRKVMLNKVEDLTSENYAKVLILRQKEEIPQKHRHTNTFDNGPENSDFKTIEEQLGIKTYFCHPYCASERGTVENRNRFIRHFFPKGTDFEFIPDDYIRWVEDLMNNRPMKVLDFYTPNEVWEREIQKAANA